MYSIRRRTTSKARERAVIAMAPARTAMVVSGETRPKSSEPNPPALTQAVIWPIRSSSPERCALRPAGWANRAGNGPSRRPASWSYRSPWPLRAWTDRPIAARRRYFARGSVARTGPAPRSPAACRDATRESAPPARRRAGDGVNHAQAKHDDQTERPHIGDEFPAAGRRAGPGQARPRLNGRCSPFNEVT